MHTHTSSLLALRWDSAVSTWPSPLHIQERHQLAPRARRSCVRARRSARRRPRAATRAVPDESKEGFFLPPSTRLDLVVELKMVTAVYRRKSVAVAVGRLFAWPHIDLLTWLTEKYMYRSLR